MQKFKVNLDDYDAVEVKEVHDVTIIEGGKWVAFWDKDNKALAFFPVDRVVSITLETDER